MKYKEGEQEIAPSLCILLGGCALFEGLCHQFEILDDGNLLGTVAFALAALQAFAGLAVGVAQITVIGDGIHPLLVLAKLLD